MGSKDILKSVNIHPPDALILKPNGKVEVQIENTSQKNVTFKLKITRPSSVKPAKTFGMVAKASRETIKISYKPAAQEKPFSKDDRISIMMTEMPKKFTTLEKFWKGSPDGVKRIVLRLQVVGQPAAKQKAQTPEPVEETEEELTSEESETEESEYD